MGSALSFKEVGGLSFERAHQVGWSQVDQVKMLAGLLKPQLGQESAGPIAKQLIDRLGSLPQVLAASPSMLGETDGVGEKISEHLAMIFEVAKSVARERIYQKEPLLGSWPALIDYIRSTMAYEPREQVRIFFLDKKNRLIADEVQQEGTVDHVRVYPREVIRRSLELSATALILAHNHPSGDPAPSSADIITTKEIAEAGKLLNIVVHDHIIMGKGGHVSLRGLKLL